MKVTKHVEHLLRQGRKPKELVELGFPKRIVTKVRRQLREGKRASRLTTEKGESSGGSHSQSAVAPPAEMATLPAELLSLESRIQQLESRVETLWELGSEFEELKADVDYLDEGLEKVEAHIKSTPAVIILLPDMKCDCSDSSYTAVYLRCIKCGKGYWWYWHPEKRRPLAVSANDPMVSQWAINKER